MLETLVKAVSLGYLLGAVHLSIAAALWSLIRGKVAPGLRANTGYWIFLGASIMTLFGLSYILYGVVTFQITMTTNYFHKLMYGGGATAITALGIGVMVLSLIMAAWSFLRARLPKDHDSTKETVDGVTIKHTNLIPTACVYGVLKPQVWVNPEYWQGLSTVQKQLALTHEMEHIRRKDNFRKLLMQFIAALYSLVPWVRLWPDRYELDSELAVDDHCRNVPSEADYHDLIANATSFTLRRVLQPVGSALSQADLKQRLDVLNSTWKPGSRPATLVLAGIACVLSTIPVVLLLSHPNTRCLLACYLGY